MDYKLPDANLNSEDGKFFIVLEQAHTPHRISCPRANSSHTTTQSGSAYHTNGIPKDEEDTVVRFKGIATAVRTGGRVTTQTNYDENVINRTTLGDNKPGTSRCSINDVVQ